MLRGWYIGALACAPAGRVEMVGGGPGERMADVLTELLSVAHRLLEVPSGDLVYLDEVADGLLQPACEPLVQISTVAFGRAS